MSGASATSTTAITDAMLGETIAFRSKNVNDQVLWEGRLESICTSVVAQMFSDIVSYNAAVRLTDPTVSTDVAALNFFIITLNNTTGNVQRYAFAEEWILAGSFAVINQQEQVTVVVYNSPNTSTDQILTVLRAAGYTCYIPTTPT